MTGSTNNQGSRHGLRLTALLLAAAIASTVPTGPAYADQPDRPVPNYDGREDPPPTAGDVFIWVPRVVFFPVYLVTEYLIRWPIGKLVTWFERSAVIERMIDVFTFGTGGSVGLVPTALIDFGFRPSIGLYLWASNAFGVNDLFSAHFAWGGDDWWRVSIRQRFPFGGSGTADVGTLSGDPVELLFHFLLDYRPDHLFYGIGPTADGPASRFAWNKLGGSIWLLLNFGGFAERVLGDSGLDGLLFIFEASKNTLGPGEFRGGEPSITDPTLWPGYGLNDPTELPGWDGYVLGSSRAELFLDSRPPRPEPGSGVRFEAFGELATDLKNTDMSYLSVGGEIDFFVDLTGNNNTLAFRQHAGWMHQIGDLPIPMPELFVVGGMDLMRGFQEGRYRGQSAFVSTLQYNYPIWVFLDGYLFVDMGNIFGPDFAEFKFDNMALSMGMGIRSNSQRDAAFELLVGVGTTRFGESTFGIDTFTVLFGTTRGF